MTFDEWWKRKGSDLYMRSMGYEVALAAWTAARAEVAPLQAAYDHLMNLQPHIAQLPKQYRGFIDPHVDEAMKILSQYMNNSEGRK